jgi:TolB-like protein/tetratricopeptide (TPR) repeat protein
MNGKIYEFGSFKLDTGRSILLKRGSQVAIGQKALALLETLVAAEGRPVSKSDLIEAAWQSSHIEESNLSVQIAALRKLLGTSVNGEEWIATIQRVGYQFVKHGTSDGNPGTGILASANEANEMPSIAVLPFINMSSDSEQEYFADGIAEDLITDLSKVVGLTVIARHSSFAFKEKQVDVKQIAVELGVRYIVQGSVRRAADRVRINMQLVDASKNSSVWGDRFDGNLVDVFVLQDTVVSKIINALEGVLPKSHTIQSKRSANIEAYDLFVRGRALVSQAPDNSKPAEELLEAAIQIEPDFADSHAWLAANHHFAWVYKNEPMEPHRSRSRAEAKRAVSLDLQNAVAHGILGIVYVYDGKLSEGADEFKNSLAINPNHADAWVFSSEVLSLEGRAEEAIESIRNAFRLNPFPPAFYYWFLGFAQYASGKYEDAVQTLRHESTYHLGSKRILAAGLAQLGHLEEARRESQLFMIKNPRFSVEYWATTHPFQNESDKRNFVEGYIKAGLPK